MNLSVMPQSEKLNTSARFPIGQPVRHRIFGFRGVIFDVDPEFNNTEEWYLSIPENMRPAKDQPFYHLFAEDSEHSPYVAYVSEQNLVLEDEDDEPIHHPELENYFQGREGSGRYILRQKAN
ncbi:MAG: heat shock protein HspQ [Alphaproteobacteria bacterium]|nr:heat shock protein HspQ [Rhodospirillales bacterium]MCW9045373.1 heat shock protein HspQ [Alphaproteobacteria bacterium]